MKSGISDLYSPNPSQLNKEYEVEVIIIIIIIINIDQCQKI